MQARLRLYLPLILLLSWLTGCGGEPVTPLPRLDTDAVILAFGDSLTYGTGAARQESYPAVLGALSGRRVVNAGVPGETTEQGLSRLPATLRKHKPDLVILCLGGNDFLRSKTPQQTRDNLASMIELVREQNIPLLLLAVPEPKFSVKPPPFYAELADRYQLGLMPDLLPDILSSRSLKSDPIHPNARGYTQMAENIADYLRRAGAL